MTDSTPATAATTAHAVRALWHLRAAQEELAKAWGTGPDLLTEAEAIDEAQRSTEFAPTTTAALPPYVQVIKTGRDKWGYRCDTCHGIWPSFATEEVATEWAALHAKEQHSADR